MSTQWEVSDRPKGLDQRIREGWVFKRIANVDYIARDMSRIIDMFKTDEEAVVFVTRRAAEGSEYHAECLAYALAQRMRA